MQKNRNGNTLSNLENRIKICVGIFVVIISFFCVLFYVEIFSGEEKEAMINVATQMKMHAMKILDQNLIENEIMLRNREIFYERGKKNGLPDAEIDEYYNKLLQDNVFMDGTLQLNSYIISDVDHNGQKDMIIMAAEDAGISASGCLYIYFNEAAAYCYQGEICCGVGFWNWSAGDIDNDENTELMIEVSNGGNGGSGGREVVILKYRNGTFEEMVLPEEFGEKYYWELYVSADINYEESTYKAYCDLLGEISYEQFPVLNDERSRVSAMTLRGFYNYRCVEYQGKNALQCSEYMYGDMGNADGVASAEFILMWDEEGNCSVAEWWLEVGQGVK